MLVKSLSLLSTRHCFFFPHLGHGINRFYVQILSTKKSKSLHQFLIPLKMYFSYLLCWMFFLMNKIFWKILCEREIRTRQKASSCCKMSMWMVPVFGCDPARARNQHLARGLVQQISNYGRKISSILLQYCENWSLVYTSSTRYWQCHFSCMMVKGGHKINSINEVKQQSWFWRPVEVHVL